MTLRSSFLQHPQPAIDSPISPARLAAEAFFAAAPIPASSDRPAPQVIVKRRRRLEVDVPVLVAEDRSSLPEHVPRTHLLSPPAPSVLDEPQPERADASPDPDRLWPRRGARRALNGQVTIIRPEVDETVARPGVPRHQVKRSPTALQPASEQLPPTLGYPRLLAKIRALEQEALQLKQREATVRWIAQAIERYDLTASDVGL